MVPLDERILEYLDEHDLATAATITREVELFASYNRVRERCYALADAELVDTVTTDRAHWELTKRGKMFLEGNLDARNQPTPRVRRFLRG